MKFLLIIVFGFVYVQCQNDAEPTVSPEHVAQYKKMWNDYVQDALKRKHPGYVESPEDECSKSCEMKPSIPKPQMTNISGYPGMIAETTKENYLRRVCRFFSEIAACDTLCPDAQRKQLVRNFLIPVKYFCEESNLINNAACLADVIFKNMSQCRDQCKSIEERMDYRMTENYTKDEVERQLSIACDMVKCLLNCKDDVRIAKCGVQANHEFRTLVGKFGIALESLRYFDIIGKKFPIPDIPDNCKPSSI